MIAPCVLEAATEDDLPAILAIERESFTHPWTVRNFRDELGDPERGRVVVLRTPLGSDGPRGRLVAYCAFRTLLDEMHVHNLAVLEDLRGRGLGRRLLALVLGLGVRRGARTAFLEVRQSNWAALQLYRSLGFEAVSVRRGYYSHPEEDALVLRKGPL